MLPKDAQGAAALPNVNSSDRKEVVSYAWREITEETIKANVNYIKACVK